MIPCVIYCAKSTRDDRESIEQQEKDCRAAIERLGSRQVVGCFSDEAKSAYKGARGEGLARAKELAAASSTTETSTELWVQHTDRLARGDSITAPHLIQVVLWARQHNVKVRSVQDDSTGDNLVMAVVMGERNWADSDRKAKSVKSGMERSVKRGKRQGGWRAYGVAADGISWDPEESKIVLRVFQEFVAGGSFSGMARGLHRDRVPTRKGGLWDPSTIKGMLTNPTYIGQVRWDGQVYTPPSSSGESQPEVNALIPLELWNRAQDLMAARPAKGKGRPVVGNQLFRKGMFFCGLCGSAMTPSTRRDGVAEYRCNRAAKLSDCSMPILKARNVDTKVLDYLLTVAVDLEATKQHLEARQASAVGLLDQAMKAQRECEAAITRIRGDYIRGAISAEDWNSLKLELEESLTAASAEVERLKANSHSPDDIESEVLLQLSAIRTAIQRQVKDSSDATSVEPVRAAIQRLFVRFEVTVEGDQGRIIAIVRDEAVRTADEEGRPVLRPVGLDLDPRGTVVDKSGLGKPIP